MPEDRVAAIRRFSRFYTRRIGVLHEGLLGSPLSLTEGRAIWELAQRERATASELAAELGLDAGYLSRILAGFEGRGLIERKPSERDGRQVIITLRSEEHTSELQSLTNLVCRLLLEKKKTNYNRRTSRTACYVTQADRRPLRS